MAKAASECKVTQDPSLAVGPKIKRFPVKFACKCKRCSVQLEVGTPAWWNSRAKVMLCDRCGSAEGAAAAEGAE